MVDKVDELPITINKINKILYTYLGAMTVVTVLLQTLLPKFLK